MALRNHSVPVDAAEARQLFSHLKDVSAIVIAVSGGPDSTALLWLLARWRKALKKGPKLLAVTVDHGLRKEGASEARAVKKLAASLKVAHRTLTWRGAKPKTGLQAAAREARYALLAQAARRAGASHVATAHSSDDQAETVLMRMSRGSGIGGLRAMVRDTKLADGLVLTRPLLSVSKARLLATLQAHDISFAHDSSNADPRFTRVRWRSLMPPLAEEGLDARTLVRLAKRAARADAALELAALGAERALVRPVAGRAHRLLCDRAAFGALPEEIRLRLLSRMIAATCEGSPPELGKLETMLEAVGAALARDQRLRRTLAGAVVTVEKDGITVERAPARRPVAPSRRKA